MLTLIGLGLWDESDITLKGLEEAKKADKIYVELYTSKWHGDLKNLEKLVGKDVAQLSRKDLEENSEKIISEARQLDIVILVQGDPMVATTHTSLIQEAHKQGIKTKIIHNASIISAVAETGLHIYKFGPSVTIPFPEKTKNKLPESVYDVIKMNKDRGLHTLCLLDVAADENEYMSANDAMKILLELEKTRKENVVNSDSEIIVFARVGGDSSIQYGKIGELIKLSFGEPPMVLIIPGMLHFTEKEHLEAFNSK
jgi:diphthine synthase